jgi:hypothetical protein
VLFFAVLFFAAAFFVAILFTTFHAARDLTVAHPWQNPSDFSGDLEPGSGIDGTAPARSAPAACVVDEVNIFMIILL